MGEKIRARNVMAFSTPRSVWKFNLNQRCPAEETEMASGRNSLSSLDSMKDV